jgi:UDP-glucose:(heptosyl)LPS alpha-1,3-glucosyltransferase
VIYNGVDCGRYSPAHRMQHRAVVRRKLELGDETVLLLLAAHNFRLKGVPELLAAARRLLANRRPVHVAIAGGRRLAKWRLFANRLGLAGRVSFVGTVTDMIPLYAAADAYVHPTYYDPCSLVLLEAAASGLPIITTRRFNGAAELFREDDEILTINDPTEGDALYERADAMFDERTRKVLGTAARHVALRNPIERNIAKIIALYGDRSRRLAA